VRANAGVGEGEVGEHDVTCEKNSTDTEANTRPGCETFELSGLSGIELSFILFHSNTYRLR
jgi:hypothetical protein